jgi:hypothetical protein
VDGNATEKACRNQTIYTLTVERNGDCLSQHGPIRSHEGRHLAQRVDLQKLPVVLAIVPVGLDDV